LPAILQQNLIFNKNQALNYGKNRQSGKRFNRRIIKKVKLWPIKL